MITNSIGYIFDCRQFKNGDTGLMENYQITFNNGTQIVNIIAGIDGDDKLMIPAYGAIDIGGLSPLSSMIETKADVSKFVRSHKPYFSKLELGAFKAVVNADLHFDMKTGELKDSTRVNFYVPKTIVKNIPEIKNNKGEFEPALVCELVSPKRGLNTMVVDENFIEVMKYSFLQTVSIENTKDRVEYLASRLGIKE